MNYEAKALRISFAVHISAIILFVAANHFFALGKKLPVIDFTVVDLVQSAGKEKSPVASGPRPTYKRHGDKSIGKGMRTPYLNPGAEPTRPKPDIQRAEPEKSSSPDLDTGRSPVFSGTGPDVRLPVRSVSTADTGSEEKKVPGISGEATARNALSRGSLRPVSFGDRQNSHGADRMTYLKANFLYIRDMINRELTYPIMARQMGWEGKVKVSFTICRDGSAKNIMIIESSGKKMLDNSAVKAVRNASPFPRPPVAAQIIIPIRYRLR